MARQKQLNLVKKISENQRKEPSEQLSLRKLMLAAGYSQQSADHPEQVLKTKSWNQLIDLFLPDWRILEKLNENALQKKSIFASNQAIDMILRIKAKYQPVRILVGSDTESMTLEELDQEIAKLELKIKQRTQLQEKN